MLTPFDNTSIALAAPQTADTFYDRLSLLAVGAILTLVAQFLIQRFIVPRVESRKRREDRWERDVLALGELLTVELPEKSLDLRSKQWAMHSTHIHFKREMGDELPPHIREYLDNAKTEASIASTAYRMLAETRKKWLISRITSMAPDSPEMKKLVSLERGHFVGVIGVIILDVIDDDFSEEKFNNSWDQERERTIALQKQVEELAFTMRVPRQPIFHRTRKVFSWLIGKVMQLPAKVRQRS